MIPLRDNIASRQFPMVNLWLIIVNVLCFVYEFQMGPQVDRFIVRYGFIPSRFFLQQHVNWLDVSRFTPVFSSMFLHGNLMHLVANMWMLWIFGDNVEDSMGHRRYLGFYLLCGIAAVFVQAVFWPAAETPMIGASGAIAGVLGAYLFSYPRAKILALVPIFIFFYMIEVPAYFFLIFWFVLQFLQGTIHLLTVSSVAQGGVAWWAHVGGFAAGIFLVFLFREKDWKKRPPKLKWR